MSADKDTVPLGEAARQHGAVSRLLRLPEVISRVGLGRSTIYLLVSRAEFPRPISIGDRAVAWVESDIDAWVNVKIAVARGERDHVQQALH